MNPESRDLRIYHPTGSIQCHLINFRKTGVFLDTNFNIVFSKIVVSIVLNPQINKNRQIMLMMFYI